MDGKNFEVRRGDIYWARLPELENSKIQSGVRPIIITSNKFATEHSPVVQYIPVTTQLKRTDLPIHVVLEVDCLYKPSMALVEQEGLIDKYRLMERIGTLTKRDMMRIDMAILTQRGIDVYKLADNIKQYNYA
jgi:mRNA interferase MazF